MEPLRAGDREINGGKGGFNIWTINGQPYDQSEPIKIHRGRRYRLAFVNNSDDMRPFTGLVGIREPATFMA
jgi:FtsP/CotA-like multicopper oxidase with cupredoxin domain